MHRSLVVALLVTLALVGGVACGGSSPEAEASWETHTTAEDETSGDEAE